MDTFLAVASKREVREYDGRPLPPAVERRILEAGRVAGSASNRQRRRFVVLRSPAVAGAVAGAVYAPGNVRGAAFVVAIVAWGKGPTAFDAARAAQNMMLTAWNEGVGSCPNGIADAAAVAGALGLDDEERVVTVVSFGYPARPADPARRDAEAWLARARRLPYDEVVSER